jgi:hypothetical protein
MTLFTYGVLAGGIAGCCLGFFVAAMLAASGDYDDWYDDATTVVDFHATRDALARASERN